MQQPSSRLTLLSLVAALPLLWAAGCSDDAADAGDADSGTPSVPSEDSGVGGDGGEGDGGDPPGPPPAPIPAQIEFELINANPGALSRWVVARTPTNTDGWWNLNEDSIAVVELRAHYDCGFPACDDPSQTICDIGESEIVELLPGQSVRGSWNLALYEIESRAILCQQRVAASAASYRVQFCWSPNPPVDGRLDPNTLSCTRLPFALGGDSVVSYAIEGLSTCGNGTCDPGETSLVCPDDCSGITATDAVIACARHCTAAASCDAEFQRDLCELQVCSALNETLDGRSDACVEATRDLYQCVAALDCAGIAAWASDAARSACAADESARAAACGG